MDSNLVTPVEAVELKIIRASPPAKVEQPPAPARLSVSASCRSLTIGTRRYAFAFHRIGCRKATNLAAAAHLSGTSPSGYQCTGKPGGGTRCQRLGHPEKYVEWHLPWRRTTSAR